MTRYLNGIPVSDLGALQITPKPTTLPSGAKFSRGWAIDPTSSFVYTADAGAAVPSTAKFQAGLAFTPDGGLYVTESTSGSFSTVNGYRVRSDGAVLINGGTPSTQFLAGLSRHLTNQGLYAGGDGASFWLPFTDLGAGEVSIVPGIGGVTGTFTRATTAYTRLSNGLWASVATGVPRSYYDASGTYLGYLAEGARTNLCLQSNDFTNAAWTKSNMTTAKTATGPDGVANSATTLTASAGNATALQAITSGSASRISSVFIKRRTGTGTINITQDNGSTWTAVTVTSAWTQVSSTNQTLTNPTVGIRIVTSGDAVDVWCFMNEVGAFASTPTPTAGSTVTRNADVLTYPLAFGAQGTISVRMSTFAAGSTAYGISFNDGSSNEAVSLGFSAFTPFQQVFDGGSLEVNQTFGSAFSSGALGNVAGAFSLNDFAASANGSAVATDTSGTMPTTTRVEIGSIAGGTSLFGTISSTSYFPVRLPNETLQSLTA